MKTRENKKEVEKKTEKKVTIKMLAMISGMVIASSTVYQSLSYAQTVAQNDSAMIGDGTGVGNGDGGGRDAYLASLQTQMGTEVETPNETPDEMIDWCDRASVALRRGMKRAMRQVSFNHEDNNFGKKQAEQTLIDTLVKVGQSLTIDPAIGGPMTKKLVDRMLKYSQRLDQDLHSNNGIALEAKLDFLFSAVKFIIAVEKELDTPYYIPFRYQYHGHYPGSDCRECSSEFDYAAFQMKFIKVAAQQLSFVIKSFTENGEKDGRIQTFPLGDPKAFLATAEMVSGDVARDLRQNLHAYINCTAIRDLQDLKETLVDYNVNQDRSIYPNSRWAVNEVADSIVGIKSEIRTYSNSCGYTDTDYEFNYGSDNASGDE